MVRHQPARLRLAKVLTQLASVLTQLVSVLLAANVFLTTHTYDACSTGSVRISAGYLN